MSRTTSAANFAAEALAEAEEMRQACEATIAQTLMEGADDDPPPPEDDTAEVDTETVVTDNGDGTEMVVVKDKDGKIIAEYVRSRTSNWRDVVHTDWDNGDKSTVASDPDGSRVYRKRPRDGHSYYEAQRDSKGKWTFSCRGAYAKLCGDCVDEPCGSCRKFTQFYPELVAACRGFEGAAKDLCKDFKDASDCCSNPKATRVDPRIIIPNVASDMVCYHVHRDTKKKKCDLQCNFASTDSDCLTNCLNTVMVDVEFSLLDHVCLQAYSEECFSNRLTIDSPISGGEPIGGSGPPTPYSLGKNFLPRRNGSKMPGARTGGGHLRQR
ncbi:MAG: hypothetical protein OEQ18_01320 [Gammaproteobacteria bacterium]|nr:hypothetical protein [Gammaproteobacteria bacterium]